MTLARYFFIFLLCQSTLALAMGSLHEQRLAKAIEPQLTVGKVQWLDTDNKSFLAIFAETEATSKQGIILLHDINAHLDWSNVIAPIRTELPVYGWSTLSLQMPPIAKRPSAADMLSTIEEASKRIDSGIKFYKKLEVADVIIVGHGLGALATAYYAANTEFKDTDEPKVQGIVLISLNGQKNEEIDPLAWIEKITLPIFEIYAELDQQGVISTLRAKRLAATRAGNKRYRQAQIQNANHFYPHHGKRLLKKIRGWMKKTVIWASKQPVK